MLVEIYVFPLCCPHVLILNKKNLFLTAVLLIEEQRQTHLLFFPPLHEIFGCISLLCDASLTDSDQNTSITIKAKRS